MARSSNIILFLGIFALALFLSHFYMYERIGYYFQLNPSNRMTLVLILCGFSFLTWAWFPVSLILPRPAASVLAWIAYSWMGIALLMFSMLAVADIVWLVLLSASISYSIDLNPLYLQYIGIAALGLTAAFSGRAIWKGVAMANVKRVSVSIGDLPPSFDGFRVVQISDLHIGPLLSGKWTQKTVDKVNELNPDIIVITGDLVDGSVEELREHVAPLARLRARHGTYFVTGNHEYYSGVEEWCAHVTRLGIRVLRNERVSITNGLSDESIDIAGVDDWYSRHRAGGADLEKALAGRDPNKSLLLLAHQPAALKEAAAHHVSLQLSGHTHGGQIWPFVYLAYFQQPYVQGLHRYRGSSTQIYVSAGTGFWGPPMRLGTCAEITELTLVPEGKISP